VRCRVCQLELDVEHQAGEVVLSYSFEDWTKYCCYKRGNPTLCAHLMPTILQLLPEKTTPFRAESRPKPLTAEGGSS